MAVANIQPKVANLTPLFTKRLGILLSGAIVNNTLSKKKIRK